MTHRVWLAALAALVGCTDETGETHDQPLPTGPCPAGHYADGEACRAAGIQPGGCAAGEVPLDDGTCRVPGVELCPDGFIAIDQGCQAILPDTTCPAGTLATPGETSCVPVGSCSATIPTGPNTEYVDGSYAGGDSDGTQAKPWTTINEAYEAAAHGAVISIAAGTYTEDLVFGNKPVQVWGSCPQEVEIVGTGDETATFFVLSGADGTEVHNLTIHGPTGGFGLSGSTGVVLQDVWVVGASSAGVIVQADLGPSELTLRHSLVENVTGGMGLFMGGGSLTLDHSVVRATAEEGAYLRDFTATGERAVLTLQHAVVEQAHDTALYVAGSDAHVQASVIRDTLTATGPYGWAIMTRLGSANTPGYFHLDGSVLINHIDAAINHASSNALITNTTISDTQPGTEGFGFGILVTAQSGPATLQVSDSLFTRNANVAIASHGDLVLERSVVRDTAPTATAAFGYGVGMQAEPGFPAPVASIVSSRFERNTTCGVTISGAIATITGTLVTATFPDAAGQFGRGLCVQQNADGLPGSAEVYVSAIDGNLDQGISVFGASLLLDGSAVDGTAARPDGLFGDGIAVVHQGVPGVATLTRSRVATATRAGMANFGSTVSLATSLLECSPIQLNSEIFDGVTATFVNGGGNDCGCASDRDTCKAISAGLAPPEAP